MGEGDTPGRRRHLGEKDTWERKTQLGERETPGRERHLGEGYLAEGDTSGREGDTWEKETHLGERETPWRERHLGERDSWERETHLGDGDTWERETDTWEKETPERGTHLGEGDTWERETRGRGTPGRGMCGLAWLNLSILSHRPKIRPYGMLLKVYVINNPYDLSHIFPEHSQHLKNPGHYCHDDDRNTVQQN